MAFAPGYDYDIFVSYAHTDNLAPKGEDGWISMFVDGLDPALRQRLGGGKDLRIFVDRDSTGANSRLPELLAAVRRSALILAIASPAYVSSEWANDELNAFCEQSADSSRIFVVEYLPLNEGELYPTAIEKHLRLEFWKPGYQHAPIELSRASDGERFRDLTRSLATRMSDKLRELRLMRGAVRGATACEPSGRNGGSSPEQLPASAETGSNRRTIVLAQPTDDVGDEAEALLHYLKQFEAEVTVLPESGYPQGGAAFRASVQADIMRAGLFVQLLGKRVGRMPPDLSEGYTRCQLEMAKAAGISIMQWRHPELDFNAVSDEAYKKIVGAETVVASGLEAFKRQILDWVRTPVRKSRPTRSSLVFINADSSDMPIAKQVQRACIQSALPAIVPWKGPSSKATREDLKANLTQCDILVFIYGDTTPDWIRDQLRFYWQTSAERQSDPRLVAICSGPPPKDDFGIAFPDARIIDCPEGWNLDAIRTMISEVRQ